MWYPEECQQREADRIQVFKESKQAPVFPGFPTEGIWKSVLQNGQNANAESQCQDATGGNIQKEGGGKWKYPEIQATLQNVKSCDLKIIPRES